MIIAINIFFTISLENKADLNWYISFMTIIEKLPNSTMILMKMIFLSHLL